MRIDFSSIILLFSRYTLIISYNLLIKQKQETYFNKDYLLELKLFLIIVINIEKYPIFSFKLYYKRKDLNKRYLTTTKIFWMNVPQLFTF